jgi:DNA sulfur modification protein DndD
VDFDKRIKESLQSFDIRQALVYCRIWFETITIEYFKKKRISLNATYSEHIKGNYPIPSLESIYQKLEDILPDKQNYNIIKKDLINWNAQNQEHHSFDEHSYNFIHAKTSCEVEGIYQAIQRFNEQMLGLEENESSGTMTPGFNLN